jgi:hypothetical protein
MGKRAFLLAVSMASFVLCACGSAESSSAPSFSVSGSSPSSWASASFSADSRAAAFAAFADLSDALLSFLAEDDQRAYGKDFDLTEYTFSEDASSSSSMGTGASYGKRISIDTIDSAMNGAASSSSSLYKAKCLMSGIEAYTDAAGSGSLQKDFVLPQKMNLYAANDAFYYSFGSSLMQSELYAALNVSLRAVLAANGYNVTDWSFPSQGYYPLAGDDLTLWQSLFPLTTKLLAVGSFALPLLYDAYGVGPGDFSFASDANGDTIAYAPEDASHLLTVLDDFIDGLNSYASSSGYSSAMVYLKTVTDALSSLRPIIATMRINEFAISFSYGKDFITSSEWNIDVSWDEAAVREALDEAQEDSSSVPLLFKFSGRESYEEGTAAVFSLPDFSDYAAITIPPKAD